MASQPKTDLTVPTIILQQLGGERFKAMTGAASFAGDEQMLSFRLKASITKHRASGMRIYLEAADTYRLELLKIRNFEVTVVDTRSGVYADDLQRVFTAMTGLDTHL